MEINWERLWDSFHIWHCEEDEPKRCKKCGESKSNAPTWEKREEKISQLVNQQLKRKGNAIY